MAAKSKPLREVKLGTLMPGFLILGILLNLAITRPPEIALDGFAPVVIRAEFQPNYQQDLDGGTFPAVDPKILEDARPANFVPANGSSSETPEATPTPSGTSIVPGIVPTVEAIVPTLIPPVVPTVVSILPTLVPPVVPTAVSIVPTVVSDTVDTVKTVVSPLDLLP